jgi:hypothetical protein
MTVSVGEQAFEIKKPAGAAGITPRQFRIALGFTVVVLFAVVLANVTVLGNIPHDLVLTYTGASIVRQGHGAKLYDLQEQAQVQGKLFKGQPLLYYGHPPFEALLFAPLTALSFRWAFVIWGAINIALWMLFISWIRPFAPVPAQPLQYLILCFTFTPLWIALMLGQTSVLLLMSFTLTFICLKRQQDFLAGLCLGLGLLKFPIVLVFALMCFLARKWKLTAGFAATASVLAVLSAIAVGREGLFSYRRLLFDMANRPGSEGYGMRFSDMPNLRGFLSTLSAGALTPRAMTILVLAVTLGLILYGARGWVRQDQQGSARSFDLTFASALVISLVASIYIQVHDLSPALLAILLVAGAYPWSNKKSLWRQGFGVTIASLYVLPVGLELLGPQKMVNTSGQRVNGGAMWLLAPSLIVFAVMALTAARKMRVESKPDGLPLGYTALPLSADGKDVCDLKS